MANINNIDDNIKLQIINILLNDPSIRNKVNNILDNSNIETDENGNSIIINKLNNNNVKIKILSEDEYEKYILNGTCDGSIAVNDENVWKHNNKNIVLIWQNYESWYVFSEEEQAQWCKEFLLHFYPESEINKDSYKAIYCVTSNSGTFNISGLSFEIVLDNTRDSTRLLAKNQHIIFVSGTWVTLKDHLSKCGTMSSSAHFIYDEANKYIPKSSSIFTYSQTGDWFTSGYRRTTNIISNICFRPAFVINDNLKSNNIFY